MAQIGERAVLDLNLRKEKSMINSILNTFWKEEDGQDMVEYSLLLAFIALAAVGLLSGIKTSISTIWQSISTNLSSAAS
jgi:Flp pilus assembly pilin Flp